MTNDSRAGAFWDRHDKLMQDPEHEARFNTELARIRAVDAEVNANDDLRTALTKLAEKWLSNKDRPSDYQDGVADAACAIRALLAAHPAPGPEYVLDRRHHVHWSLTESQATPDLGARALIESHVAEFEASIDRLEASIQDPNNTTGGREYDTAKLHGQRGAVYALRRLAEALAAPETGPVCGNCLGHGVETCAAHPAPVSDTRREDVARVLWPYPHAFESALALHKDYYLDKADAVLAALPAPPVVDEAEVRERIAQDIARAVGEGTASDIARGATR